jgi:hypothetical protein
MDTGNHAGDEQATNSGAFPYKYHGGFDNDKRDDY